jgi:hypothetical protein
VARQAEAIGANNERLGSERCGDCDFFQPRVSTIYLGQISPECPIGHVS